MDRNFFNWPHPIAISMGQVEPLYVTEYCINEEEYVFLFKRVAYHGILPCYSESDEGASTDCGAPVKA